MKSIKFICFILCIFIYAELSAYSTIKTIPIPSSSANSVIASDGDHLWLTVTGAIHKLSPTDGSIVKTIPSSFTTPQAMVFVDGYLWLADGYINVASPLFPTLNKIDTSNGNVLQSYTLPRNPTPGHNTAIPGIIYKDDQFYLSYGNGANTIFEVDTLGNVINSFLYKYPGVMAFDGKHTWLANGLKVYKLDGNTWAKLDSFLLPKYHYPHGMAFDGTYLWTSNGYYDIARKLDVGYVVPTTSGQDFSVKITGATPTYPGGSILYPYPGGGMHYRLKYANYGTVAGPIKLKAIVDSSLIYAASSLTPSTVNNDTVSWTISNVLSGHAGIITVNFNIDSSTQYGDIVHFKTTVEALTGVDSNLSNNSDSLYKKLVPYTKKQLSINPGDGNQGLSMSLSFTSTQISFTASSPCVTFDSAHIIFTHPATGYSFNAYSVSVLNADTLNVGINIPTNAPLGYYNVLAGIGKCPLACNGCFRVDTIGPDLFVDISGNTIVHKGNTASYQVDYENRGTTSYSNADVAVVFPTEMTYQSSSVAYTSLSTDTVRWNLGALAPNDKGSINVDFLVGNDPALYGATLNDVKTFIQPISGDVTPADNQDSIPASVFMPALVLLPDTGKAATSLTVKFTGSSANFLTASNCLSPNSVKFTHRSTGFSFNSTSTNIINTDTADGFVGIPSTAPLGSYDVAVGSCFMSCTDCFRVVPDFTLMGENLGVYLTALTPSKRLTAPKHQVFYQNKGTDTVNAVVTLQYDTNLTYSSSIPTPTSNSGYEVSWTIANLMPGETGTIEISYSTLLAALNTSLHTSVKIEPITGDLDTLDNLDELNQVVVNAYDPNDKLAFPDSLVPIDWEYMTYTLRFQNTGNAAANRVIIIDTISTMLDFSSIRTVAASHGYYYEPEANNRVIKWTFDNINLPDSGSDWEGSQGFVKYQIQSNGNWQIRDTFLNNADIYFDLNPPVRTNTTVNHVFDCDSLANHIMLTDDSVCKRDIIVAQHIGFGAEELLWSFSGDSIDNLSNLEYVPEIAGHYQLELLASNGFCASRQVNDVVVEEADTPIITVNALELTSDITEGLQWYFEGNPLSGETGPTLIATQNGWYFVSHTTELGCMAYSDSVEITIVGINAITNEQAVSIYPNPSNGHVWITLLHPYNEQLNIEVYDIKGELVSRQTLVSNRTGNKLELDLNDARPGVYVIAIFGEHMAITQKLILQRQ